MNQTIATVEQRLTAQIGQLVIQNVALQFQVEQQQAQITAMQEAAKAREEGSE